MKYTLIKSSNKEIIIESYFYDDIEQYIEDNNICMNKHFIQTNYPCKGTNCNNNGLERFDFHGLSTGYYCDSCYENNYPYKKHDYTNKTGIADDGTPIKTNY